MEKQFAHNIKSIISDWLNNIIIMQKHIIFQASKQLNVAEISSINWLNENAFEANGTLL